MRYRQNITCCADGGPRLPAQRFASRPDTARIGRGAACSSPTAKRRCTRLVVWYLEPDEPGIIRTDLAPDQGGPSWYARRCWIGLGFQAIKSLGWQWDQTRRTAPARISRHGLVRSVATRLARAEAPGWKTPRTAASPQALAPNHRDPGSRPPRTVSVIRHGIDWLRRLLLKGRLWSRVCLNPGRNPSPTWRSHTMRRPENPLHTPVSGSAPGVGVAVCPQPNRTAWSWASSASASTCSA